MPFLDRFWWLQRIVGIVAAVLLVTLAVWLLTSLLGLPQRFHLPVYSVIESWGVWPWLLCFSAATSLLPGSISARDRHERRARAMAGELDAIPLARITAHPEDAPAEADLPISFVERAPTNSRRAQIAGNILLGVLFCLLWVMLFALIILLLMAINFQDDPLFFAALTSFLLAGFVWLALYYAGRASSARAASGVRADATGIRQLRRNGEGPLLRWEDARLLELTTDSAGAAKYDLYTLYSVDATVQWRDYRLSAGTPSKTKVSRAESDRHLRQLLALVTARTGLQPRTFVHGWQRRTPGMSLEEENRNRRSTAAVIASLLGVAIVLLVVGVAALALPLSRNPVFNLYAFATLALAGGSLLAFAARQWGFALAPPARPQSEYVLPAAPATTSGMRYGFVSGMRQPARLRMAAVGLALAGDFVCGAVGGVGSTGSGLRAGLTTLTGTLVMIAGIVGLLIFGVAMILRPSWVWVDDIGLHEHTKRKTRTLPWDKIRAVILQMDEDQPQSFEVRGGDGQPPIIWFARGTTWPWANDAAHFVSPEELAALVIARSGVPLTIKET